MESSDELDEQMIKTEEPQINSEKLTKKNTLKKPGKTDKSPEKTESYAKETENFVDGKIEEGRFYKEDNTERSLEKQESYNAKSNKIKNQATDAKKEKDYDEVFMTAKKAPKDSDDYEYKQEIEDERRVLGMSSDEDNGIKRSFEKDQKKGFGVDPDKDVQGSDFVLEKKQTLKKQYTNQKIDEDGSALLLNKKSSIKNPTPEIKELSFAKKKTAKISEEIKDPAYDGTTKKKPKKQGKLENNQAGNIENIANPSNVIEEFKGFKDTFSAENNQRFFEEEEPQVSEKKNKKPKKDMKKLRDSSRSDRSNSRSRRNDKQTFDEDNEKSFKQERPENLINRLFADEIMTHANPVDKVPECPETPNLGSPIKETKYSKGAKDAKGAKDTKVAKDVKDVKDIKRSQGSAYWSRNEFELENEKLRAKVLEYEEVIKQQSEEIKELKRQLGQKTEKPKRISSPKSSGHIQKKPDDIFLKKKADLFKKEDMDFWKIVDDGQGNKEPQRLEDIAALKDLWILNIDSGSALYNNLSIKKPQGVKSNALTRVESSKGGNMKSRVLPKIATKSDLRSISKK